MNEWTNERINKGTSEWMYAVNKWINEWKNEWKNEWMGEWRDECMCDWITEGIIFKMMTEWMKDCMIEWLI